MVPLAELPAGWRPSHRTSPEALVNYFGERDFAPEQCAHDQLGSGCNRVAPLCRFDMFVHRRRANIEKLRDHGVALPTRSEEDAIALALRQWSRAHVSLAVFLILPQRAAGSFESEATKRLGRGDALHWKRRVSAHSKVARSEGFSRDVVRHGEAFGQPEAHCPFHMVTLAFGQRQYFLNPAPEKSGRGAFGSFQYRVVKALILAQHREPLEWVIGKSDLVA